MDAYHEDLEEIILLCQTCAVELTSTIGLVQELLKHVVRHVVCSLVRGRIHLWRNIHLSIDSHPHCICFIYLRLLLVLS